MQLLRFLQHWLTGRGPCLQVADFVPETRCSRFWVVEDASEVLLFPSSTGICPLSPIFE
jgi:hypothetical protein